MELAKQSHQQPEGGEPNKWADPLQLSRIDILVKIAEFSARQALYQDPNAAHDVLAAFTPPHDAASGSLSSQQLIENAQALLRLARGAQGIADMQWRMRHDILELLR